MFTKNNVPHNKGKIKDIKKLCTCTDFEIIANKKVNLCTNSNKNTANFVL